MKDTITITKEQFNEAVKQALDNWEKKEDAFETEKDTELSPMSKITMFLQNTLFAGMLRNVLFDENN